MSNPFENEAGHYLVLVNSDNQHSLWPVQIAVPAGWARAHGPDTRQACLDYVDSHWTDLRPSSLVAAIHKEAHR